MLLLNILNYCIVILHVSFILINKCETVSPLFKTFDFFTDKIQVTNIFLIYHNCVRSEVIQYQLYTSPASNISLEFQ